MFGKCAIRAIAVLSFAALALAVSGCGTASAQYYELNLDAWPQVHPTPQASAVPEPFGIEAVPVTTGEVIAKWDGLIADVGAEKDVLEKCRSEEQLCPAAARKLLAVVADGRAHDGRARIGIINRDINLAIRPTSDVAQWGVQDRWSAPLATLAAGRGDCEDYAIAKYVALREAGVAESELRLVIVRDLASGQDHAVAATRLDDKWIILDNRRLTLVEDVDMPRVLPLFVLDSEGVKQFAPTVATAQGAPARAENRASSPSALGF
jgi:predicted transglutaminase-like cysteine proteinase